MAKKRKTTTKAKRGVRPPPRASYRPTEGVVAALSGGEVLWHTRPDDGGDNSPATLHRAPIVAWRITSGDTPIPITVEDTGLYSVIRHANGSVADPYDGTMFADETVWLASLQPAPAATEE